MNQTTAQDTHRQDQIAKEEQVISLWKIVWNQFLDHKAALVGLMVIALFVIVALLAPLISSFTGLSPETQNPLGRYQKPMTRLELDSGRKEDLVSTFEAKNPEWATSLRKQLTEKALVSVVREEDSLYDFVNAPLETQASAMNELKGPEKAALSELVQSFSTLHILGTDELGRDVFIRLIYGTRISIGVGVLVALSAALVGLLIGSLAGFYGGFIDALLMRVTDALLSLPTLPVLIVVSAVSVDKVPGLRTLITEQNENIMKLVFILVLFSWMTVARLVRAEVLSLREREFILAARTLGARDRTILIKHLFPNVVAPLLVSVTLGIGESIQFEAALSFLGLGIQQPTPSWGNMLFNAQDLITEAPALAILPGILILVITICFNYLGDGLQDAINPKSIRR